MEPVLHGAPFLNFLKFDILKFEKIWKKFNDVDNNELYPLAKNQCEIFCILGYVKITNFRSETMNSDKFKNVQISENICHFCVGRDTNYFALIFRSVVE
jgi:hypothetical protein